MRWPEPFGLVVIDAIASGSRGQRLSYQARKSASPMACGQNPAIARVTLIGNFNVLHNATKFSSRGRVLPCSHRYTQVGVTPVRSATSATDRPRSIRAL